MRALRLAAWTLSLAVSIATLLGMLDRFDFGEAGWLIDLAAHFPRQVAAMALLVAMLSVTIRLWRAAQFACAAFALNFAIALNPPAFAIPTPAAPARRAAAGCKRECARKSGGARRVGEIGACLRGRSDFGL